MTEHPATRLVILDRDGVINEDSDAYIRSVDDWQPVPGSPEAIARLSKAGYLVAVATNQSGLARGYFDEITLANIHNLLCATIEAAGGRIDALCYCPHGPDEECACRKPRPGLLDQIAETLGVPLAGAWLVGDSMKDIAAACARNCRPLLVRSGKGRLTETQLAASGQAPVPVFDSLASATDYILAEDAADSREMAP